MAPNSLETDIADDSSYGTVFPIASMLWKLTGLSSQVELWAEFCAKYIAPCATPSPRAELGLEATQVTQKFAKTLILYKV